MPSQTELEPCEGIKTGGAEVTGDAIVTGGVIVTGGAITVKAFIDELGREGP